jgi:hypothetical protein
MIQYQEFISVNAFCVKGRATYWVYKTSILMISYMYYQYIALITYTSMLSFEANAIVSLVTLDIVSLVTLDSQCYILIIHVRYHQYGCFVHSICGPSFHTKCIYTNKLMAFFFICTLVSLYYSDRVSTFMIWMRLVVQFHFLLLSFLHHAVSLRLRVPDEGYSECTWWRLFWAYLMKVIPETRRPH